jgi:hypothetical protein
VSDIKTPPPDISHPTAKLAEFLINPSDHRQQAADRLIRYFYATRYLAIQYSGKGPTSPTRVDEINRSLAAQVSSNQSSDLQIASDAAFADDPLTRKSSQGSILSLFGGLVSWKAGKQDTVTTSLTEAELLAFTHIVKQAIATKRLFDQLDLQLDQCQSLSMATNKLFGSYSLMLLGSRRPSNTSMFTTAGPDRPIKEGALRFNLRQRPGW